MADVVAPRSGPRLSRQLRGSHALAAVCLISAYALGGLYALAIATLLALLEALFSAASAVFNAGLLARLSRVWQQAFLTVGLLITTVGVRFAAPLAVVSVSAGISPAAALRLLLTDPDRYRLVLLAAQPYIGAFVGIFLLTTFLEFVFDERDVVWIRWIEVPLRRLGKIPRVAELIALAFSIIASATVPANLAFKVEVAALAALGFRLLASGIAALASTDTGTPGESSGTPVSGRGALGLFCYLELLNAAVSVDSVATALSVTANVALIALGLLIGASYLRSVSVYLARGGDEDNPLAYLEHGKQYAVGLISVLMLATVWHDVPADLVRTAGATVILAAVAHSVWAQRRQARALRSALDTQPSAEIRPFRTDPGSDPSDAGVRARRHFHPYNGNSDGLGMSRIRLSSRLSRRNAQARAAQGLAPLHIYLADASDHAQVEQGIEAWLSAAGLEVVDREPPVLGSWSRTLWVRIRTTSHGRTAREVAATLVRTAELKTYTALDAQVTATLMQSAAQALAALQNSKDAVIRLGAILIVKVDWVPVVTQLSAAQQLKLDHHPEMLDTPAQVLRYLGLHDVGSPVPEGQPHALDE